MWKGTAAQSAGARGCGGAGAGAGRATRVLMDFAWTARFHCIHHHAPCIWNATDCITDWMLLDASCLLRPERPVSSVCVRVCRHIASGPVHCLNQVTCVYHASMGP